METKSVLTYRDLLKAQVAGKTAQYWSIDNGGAWLDFKVTLAVDIHSLDDVLDSGRYRIKPETKTVRVFNGVELPDCITEPLELGDTFYLALFGGVALRTWSYHTSELDAVVKGFAYLNREDAEVHHKALATYETIERPKE